MYIHTEFVFRVVNTCANLQVNYDKLNLSDFLRHINHFLHYANVTRGSCVYLELLLRVNSFT